MDYSDSSGTELQVMPNKKEFLIMYYYYYYYYWKSQDCFFMADIGPRYTDKTLLI